MTNAKRLLVACAALALMPGIHAFAHSIDLSVDVSALKSTPLPKELAQFEQSKPQGGANIRGVLDSTSLWELNKLIVVCFMDGDAERKKLFVEMAGIWTNDVSVNFAFGPASTYFNCATKQDADLRIAFRTGDSYSVAGTGANDVPRSDPTMNIGVDAGKPVSASNRPALAGTILHELGHALGLDHEHQNAKAKCFDELDMDKIRAELEPRGWTRKDIELNFYRIVASERYKLTAYDKRSIMHYALPAEFFKTKTAASCFVPENFTLSNGDKELVAMAYPKSQAERDAYLGKLAVVASAAIAPTPLSTSELASLGNELTKNLNTLGSKAKLNFDFKNSANIRGDGDVEMQGCDRMITSNAPAQGVRCEIADDASYLSIGGE